MNYHGLTFQDLDGWRRSWIVRPDDPTAQGAIWTRDPPDHDSLIVTTNRRVYQRGVHIGTEATLTPIPARQMVEGDLYADDGRVRCAHCYGDVVHYSQPAWFDPNRDDKMIDVDPEASPYVYCGDCDDTRQGWHHLTGPIL